MFDAASIELVQKIGGSLGGIALLAFIVWQAWVKIRQELKENSKGDKIDERISSYADTLQKTVDKLVTKIESLQTQNNELVLKSAQLSAELVITHAEAEGLKKEISEHIERIRYLETTLKTNGIAYVQ